MNPSVFAAAALGVFLRLCPVILVLIHAFYESRAARRYSQSFAWNNQDYSMLWLISCLSFCGYEIYVCYSAFSLGDVTAQYLVKFLLGLSLFAWGVHLRTLAIRKLGKSFAMPPWAQSDISLKRDGVFGRVRHPSELGFVAICLGLALVVDSTAAFGIFASVLLPLTLLRVRQEEQWLKHHTNGAYTAYAASVQCMLPAISVRHAGRTEA
jgi:protein-S-isoprenylcysteine O-methyltransferase Ste14